MPPSEVSFPSAFTAGRSHRSHAHSHGRVPLHPWVFSTLRCLAPQSAFRVYFAPVTLLGFAPRGLVPRHVPFAFSGLASLMTFHMPTEVSMPHLQGFSHVTKRARMLWLFTATLYAASASFLSFRASYLFRQTPRATRLLTPRALRCASPLLHFLVQLFTLSWPPVLQGLHRKKRHTLSLETVFPSWSFSPRRCSPHFETCTNAGRTRLQRATYPRSQPDVTARSNLSLRPAPSLLNTEAFNLPRPPCR